jgi:hypothetical protein
MAVEAKIIEQWRYLRGLLLEQLEAFAAGELQVHANEVNVSDRAMAKLRVSIAEFDALIAGQSSADT